MKVSTARPVQLAKNDTPVEPEETEIVPDGEIDVKLDSAVVGFYFEDGAVVRAPLGARKFLFKVVKSPRDSSLDIYLLYKLKPSVFVNINVVNSLPAEACEVKLYGPNDSAQLE